MENLVEIVNNALIFLGERPIQSLEQPTQPAVLAAALWPGCRDEVLRAHPWNFAIKRAVLAPLAEAPAFGYGQQFALPADWLRTLDTDIRNKDYKMEGRRILCNATSLQLRYVARIDEVRDWDALAASAAARCLASKLAYPLTKSASLQDAQWQLYVQVLGQARSVDAQEDPADEFEESSLLSVRRG